jgi:NitT/TauT family transport system substrate-binding protein
MSANILSFGRIRSLAAAMAVVIVGSTAASAADKVTFLTSWFAQAEHGGF